MNWNSWIRQGHRWLSIAFTLGVITYMVVVSGGQPAAWVGLLALIPLILLLLSGLYLFVPATCHPLAPTARRTRLTP